MYMSNDYFVKFHDFFLEIFEHRYCIIRYVSNMSSKATDYGLKILLPLPVFLKKNKREAQ